MSAGPLVKQGSSLPAAVRGTRGDGIRAANEAVQEFLVFTLGAAQMGLPLPSVREILKLVPITEVPRAAHDVLGILSVRGRITTIIDLRARLGQPSVQPTRHTRILLVAGDGETLGVVVDTVRHVVRLRADEIESSHVVSADLPDHVLGLGRPRRRDAVRGVVGQDSRGEASEAEVIVLLDPEALLRR